MCLFTKYIKNKRYQPTKKNKGNPEICTDKRKYYVPIGCGECIECRRQKRNEWLLRIEEERKNNSNKCIYTTFTFSDEALKELSEAAGTKEVNAVAKLAVRRFLERWRKKYKTSVKHFFVTELGEKEGRIHLHGFLFTNEKFKTINEIWKYGITKLSVLKYNYAILYVVKYISKEDKVHTGYKPVICSSPGLGKIQFKEFSKFNEEKTKEYVIYNRHKYGLPIYWRNIIYSEEERQKLWEYKLNENKRYILGTECKADDLKKFTKLNERARQFNKDLGFGDNKTKRDTLYYADI